VLPERDLLPLALFSSTTLPLVVAMTYLGVRTGDMLPENASALVGAAVISVTVFPTLAILLRSKSEEARPEGVVAIAAHRAADLASALFSRFHRDSNGLPMSTEVHFGTRQVGTYGKSLDFGAVPSIAWCHAKRRRSASSPYPLAWRLCGVALVTADAVANEGGDSPIVS
jgi:hypothetical protein